MTNVGQETRGIFSIEGNASQHQVRWVPGNATLMPERSGEWRIKAAIRRFELAKSTEFVFFNVSMNKLNLTGRYQCSGHKG